METVGLNMASITPEMPDVVRPEYMSTPYVGNTVSKWRELEDELGYYLEETESIEGSPYYDSLIL